MDTILPKKSMSEEDIKFQYITPAITAKWGKGKITLETLITDGKINLRGNLAVREKPKRADYILYLNANNPIAVVEAKDNRRLVTDGLQQAMTYAAMLDLPFAYSFNGDGFVEHDLLTGQVRQFALDEFPSEDELIARYEREANLGRAQEEMLTQPYYTSQTTHNPRCYQRIAINLTVDAIARGQQRLLLVMATGTGKTYTAFQIVYRLLKSGMKRKVLYLADRNILVDQSIQQDFAPLERRPSQLTRCISRSASSWWATTIRSTSARCLRRISSISSSWTSATGAPPRRRAAGGGYWNTFPARRRSA